MKQYAVVLSLLLVGCLILMIGLSLITGDAGIAGDVGANQLPLPTEAWCDAMVEKPNAEWREAEILQFSQHCLND